MEKRKNVIFHSELSHENIAGLVVPFINQYFSVHCRADYENKYVKLDEKHGEIANHVEAIMVSWKDDQFPINTGNTKFFTYKLNRSDPELEMIEVRLT